MCFYLGFSGFPSSRLVEVVQVLMLSLQYDLPVVGDPAAPFETHLQFHLRRSSL